MTETNSKVHEIVYQKSDNSFSSTISRSKDGKVSISWQNFVFYVESQFTIFFLFNIVQLWWSFLFHTKAKTLPNLVSHHPITYLRSANYTSIVCRSKASQGWRLATLERRGWRKIFLWKICILIVYSRRDYASRASTSSRCRMYLIHWCMSYLVVSIYKLRKGPKKNKLFFHPPFLLPWVDYGRLSLSRT